MEGQVGNQPQKQFGMFEEIGTLETWKILELQPGRYFQMVIKVGRVHLMYL